MIADATDTFVGAFAAFAVADGWDAERLNYAEAAQRFSIARNGSVVRVTPASPLLLRLPAAVGAWASPEAQFHHAEICSVVWAAAALTAAPVINRPDTYGFLSRATSCATVLRRRTGQRTGGVEIYSNALPAPPVPETEWWAEPYNSRSPAPWTPQDLRKGPFRAGHVRPGFVLHTVVVAAGVAFDETSPTDVLDASVRVCRELGLKFALVTWRHYRNTGETILVRVSPQPTLDQVGPYFNAVADRLLVELAA